MVLIVEDGNGLSNAESYSDVSTFEAYMTSQGYDFGALAGNTTAKEEAALRRATLWVDGYYRPQFMGFRRNLRRQSLEWPRVGVIDADGFPVDFATLPVEIVRATQEAGWRELVTPNSMQPDLDRGGLIKRLKAGSVEIEYGDGAIPNTTFATIDGLLQPLLGIPAQYTAQAIRG